MGHKSTGCWLPKRTYEANLVDNITQDVSEINLSTVVYEVNLIGSNPREWWIDTSATRHVCSDKGAVHFFRTKCDWGKAIHDKLCNFCDWRTRQGDHEDDIERKLTLNNVLYVLVTTHNIILIKYHHRS